MQMENVAKKLFKREKNNNPGQNYLRKFSPSCPLSYATKLFPKRRLCGKKTPSPNSMLLPTNAQGSGFLLNTQQHCFQGKEGRTGTATMFRKMLSKYTIFSTVLSKIEGIMSALIVYSTLHPSRQSFSGLCVNVRRGVDSITKLRSYLKEQH